MKQENGREFTVYKKMIIIRHRDRPTATDYIKLLFEDFIELHGDRTFGDDMAICAGIASFKGRPVTVIAQRKGKSLAENQKYNFAMAHPEGYRKALRLMKQAEKFHRPVICFVDTAGAFCGVGAEERGQGEAIARNLYEMSILKTPIVSIILGEGGSGGALALAVCDSLAMLENATYSIISPKGFASILWRDPSREKEAAEIMKITAQDLLGFGVADHIIKEPEGGAHKNPKFVAFGIQDYLERTLGELSAKPIDEILRLRFERFRKVGEFSE